MNLRRTLLTAVLLATPAAAQSGGNLPLVAVGDGTATRWVQNAEEYRLVIPPDAATRNVGLEVYSPGLNANDYANGRAEAGYYGDELYGRNVPFDTTFTLSGPGGVIVERRYGLTTTHDWESLVPGPLPAGTYTLRVQSHGNGKNAYALRAAAPFALESSDFTVNARSKPGENLTAARLSVPQAWVGRTLDLSNYDADGPAELALTLLLPNGERVPLTSSGDVESRTDRLEVTPERVGEWTILASVQAGTKQYSNAVTFRVRDADAPAYARVGGFPTPQGQNLANYLGVEVVDAAGRPIPGATYTASSDNTVRPRLPSGYLPVSATLVEGTGNILSAAEVRYVPGRTRIRFVARTPEGGLNVDAVAVLGDARVPLPGVTVDVNGRTFTLPATAPLPPGEYTLTPAPVPGATIQPRTVRIGDGDAARVTLEYAVRTDLTLTTTPDIVAACDVTQLTATARTDFPYRLPATLRLGLPAAWSSDYPLELRGDLSSTTPLRLRLPARVCASDAAQATLDPSGLTVTGEARVLNPAGANVTRTTQLGSATQRAQLNKAATAAPGGYTVTLSLTVDAALDNVRITDPLPGGATRGPLNVRGPSLANLNPRTDGDQILLARVLPGTYTLTYTLTTDAGAERAITTPDLNW
ncbi:hypothetical protein [Deinococcus maricopensis]|uniref:Uncharacterized protein n=1 Tax=Deinococcus maricopensis (strain DSM 21211 / LMG 22137 / NRRL B-23946 / LB-34) TaxID=709986 RepID=E8U9U2_DEIML|nr:hypothetical protein [Deinococcus maricopensis]ADV67831.1 hypothetical protein Deima_2191 [Deinococcus maricopensis DSM 21211]